MAGLTLEKEEKDVDKLDGEVNELCWDTLSVFQWLCD